MKFAKKVRICEVGPRDGLQNEARILTVDEKVAFINRMTEAGYPVIEVGSFMSPKAVPQMADTDEVYRRITRKEGTEYRALIANIKGVERAAACGAPKVKLNVSASRAHNIANLNRTPEESVAGFADCVALAKENGIEISGSISMPFGSPWEHKIPVSDVRSIIEAYLSVGIDEISLSDAPGMAIPSQVNEMGKEVIAAYPNVRWILHLHNTRGMAMANLIAGLDAGFETFDSALSGLGGCPFIPGAAGNIASEDVLHMLGEMGIDTGVDIDRVIAAGKWLADIVGHAGDSYIQKAGKNSELIRDLPQKK